MNQTSMAILIGLLAGIGGGLATHFIAGNDTTAGEATLQGGSADLSGVIARLDRIESAMGRKHLAARRPELYRDILGAPNETPVIDPSWDLEK